MQRSCSDSLLTAPELMIRMLIIGYVFAIRSERALRG
jgi:transposase